MESRRGGDGKEEMERRRLRGLRGGSRGEWIKGEENEDERGKE